MRQVFGCLLVLMVLLVGVKGQANQLTGALEAGEASTDFLEGALTGLYQNALRSSEDTGNFEIDLIGSFVLGRGRGGIVGDTDFVFWAFHVDNLGGLQSTGEMRQKAGLLWDTNDINVDSPVTQFGVFGLRQFFFGNRMELGVGKLFPGMIHTESNYTANNSETFTSKIISASAVGGYFEAIGLGANIKYWADQWFVQGGFTDAKAESEFDFSSLADGVLAWTAEAGWAPYALGGSTSVSLLAFSVDETPTLREQSGWGVAAAHGWGEDGTFDVFGRYTWASGGEGIGEENSTSALPLASAAFIGLAHNRPMGRTGDLLGVAALHGQPTAERRALGYSSQYGIEAFWRLGLGRTFRLIPSIQVLRNQNGDPETILGIRAKLSDDFAKHFSGR